MSCLVYWPIGTIQLEMRQLSHYTGSKQYAQAADRISHLLEKKQREDPRGADIQTNTRNKRKEESETTRLYCIVLHCTLLIFLRQSEGKSQEFQWRRGWIDGWCAGLWNTYINRESAEDGSPTLFTFGAMSDSAVSLIESSAVRHACARVLRARVRFPCVCCRGMT